MKSRFSLPVVSLITMVILLGASAFAASACCPMGDCCAQSEACCQ